MGVPELSEVLATRFYIVIRFRLTASHFLAQFIQQGFCDAASNKLFTKSS